MFEEWTEKRFASVSYTPFAFPTVRDRAFWTSLDKEITEPILKEADALLTHTFPMMLATDYLALARTGDRWAQENKYAERRTALNRLSVAYCITEDEKYIDTILNLLFMISEETFWGVSAHFTSYSSDPLLPHRSTEYIDLFAAETGSNAAWTLYLTGDKLKEVAPGLVDEIYRQFDERLLTPFEKHTDWWWQGYYRKINNWNPWIVSNIISVTALSPLPKERKDALYAKCMEVISHFTRDYPADGGCDEGTNYWGKAGASLFDALEQMYMLTGGALDYFDHPLIRNMANFMPAMHIAGPYFVNYGDGSANVGGYGLILYAYGKAVHSEEAETLGAMLYKSRPVLTLGREMRDFLFGLQRRKEIEKESGAPKIPADSVLPDLGIAVFRECTEEAKGLAVAVKGGCNAESHNHNDVGSITVYKNGAPAVLDAGVETYRRQTFGPERYTIWTMQSGWHNLPVINGTEEKDGKEYRASAFRAKTGECSSAEVSFADAFPAEAKLKELTRTLTMDRKNACITVSDRFAFTEDGNRVEEHLLLYTRPQVEKGKIKAATVRGERFILRFDPSYRVEVTEKQLTDPSIHRAWGTDFLWRVSLSADALPDHAEITYTIS